MYKEQIIKQLYYSDRLSCTDLSRLIHKSIPFTSATVNELIEENVLIEEGLATSTGGRKPHVFSLKPDYFYIFAIAINQLNTRMAIYDLTGNSIVPIQSISIPLAGNPGALETITEYAKQMLLSSNIDTSKVLAAGVGMPGFIN
nr:sugar kinase [Saprospiraceae bacterium]